MSNSKKEKISYLAINILLLLSSSLLFAFAQPNAFVYKGVPLLAYVIFIPLFLLIRRISFASSFLWGGIYGALNYIIFSYWLWSFHPLAMYIVALEYFLYYLFTIPCLKLADMYFPRYGFIVQWLIWVSYEYIKTLGFLGFSYGLVGYSQWSWTPLIQIASITGVWGVSALVVFPSAWIAAGLKAHCKESIRKWAAGFPSFFTKERRLIYIWLLCFIAVFVFGLVFEKDYSRLPKKRIVLIQPNADPWVGGIETYKKEFEVLKRLSSDALAEYPDTALVVWPETAFIPRIAWHYKYREDREAFELVHALLTYLNEQPAPFLIGNDDAVKEINADGILSRTDYNAALLFRPGVNIFPPEPERYRKMHLVPFTEHFPYKKTFPLVYEALLQSDTHFWEKGTDPAVFSINDLVFGVPICFEDTFGYITRRFALNGAKLIVNMSNDAWAQSAVCQYQHLSMAAFRAVETGLPVVRATASGQTVALTPHGRVSAMLQPFTSGYLAAEVPVLPAVPRTGYSVLGDSIGMVFTLLAGILLLLGTIRYIVPCRIPRK